MNNLKNPRVRLLLFIFIVFMSTVGYCLVVLFRTYEDKTINETTNVINIEDKEINETTNVINIEDKDINETTNVINIEDKDINEIINEINIEDTACAGEDISNAKYLYADKETCFIGRY